MTLQSEDMGKLVTALVDAVEGPPGYGTLRNADGVRLKDHPAWVSVYLAARAFRPAHREAQPETDGGGEDDAASALVKELRLAACGLFQLSNERGDYGYFDDIADRVAALASKGV